MSSVENGRGKFADVYRQVISAEMLRLGPLETLRFALSNVQLSIFTSRGCAGVVVACNPAWINHPVVEFSNL